jgi:hypothetical protein
VLYRQRLQVERDLREREAQRGRDRLASNPLAVIGRLLRELVG